MTEVDRAWLAGFYDGEGNATFTSNGRKKNGLKVYTVRIKIAQKTRGVLDRIQELTGLGKVYGPYTTKGKTYFQYAVHRRKEMEQFRDVIWPYLYEVKQEQFERVFKSHRMDSAHLPKTDSAEKA